MMHHLLCRPSGGSAAGRRDRRNGRALLSLALALAVVAGAACSSDETGTGPNNGPFDLTFELDASFQGAHGGQAISAAVVKVSDGSVVARRNGMVSASQTPAFAFTIANLLEDGAAYRVDYWIDSNFGGGTVGVCDPKDTDHQWRVSIAAVSDDVTVMESHAPANTQDVCTSFTVALTFAGDASFQGAHGGQEINVALIKSMDGSVLARANGTVSASTDPAFSFSFPGELVIGIDYEVHYWIDSNFGGGTVGVCDPKANDHQWSVAVSSFTDDVTVTEAHAPANTEDVCTSFTAALSFAGDASFQTPHGGQDITVKVVRSVDGAVVATGSGTVSGSQDPSFSFDFSGVLLIGYTYDVEYWIDSNFGGGTVGVCDAPSVDHQWRVSVAMVEMDVNVTESHDAGALTDVCPAPVSFASDIQPIFTANCAFAGCHGNTNTQPTGKPMELTAGQAYANIVSVSAFELAAMNRIEPGDPDDSYLIHKIQGTQASVGGSGSQMPLGGTPLDAATIQLIRMWVEQGANDN